jgi:uncharacterized membrane protein YkoI
MTAVRLSQFVFLAFFIFPLAGRTDEKKIPLDQVPKGVLDAVKAKFAGATLFGAETETENGKTEYEIALRHNDQKIEVTLTPDGKITGIEKQIRASDLPAAVAQALKQKYAGAAYKTIEEVIKPKDGNDEVQCYEVLLVTEQNKRFEVSVNPEGRIIKEEDKNKAKED